MLSLDINLLWVSKCTYPAKYVIKKNHHDYYQIVFVLNGEGDIIIGDSVNRAGINQVYIFKPNVEHKIVVSNSKSLNIVELKFYCNNVTTESMVYGLPFCIRDVGQPIRTAFINVVEEIKIQDKYTGYIIDALLTQLIFSMTRAAACDEGYNHSSGINKFACKDNENIKNDMVIEDPLDDIVDYIRQNYSLEIKLNDLAEMAYLSPIYFCSVFKERYGVSPIQYLQNVRHENAKKLLIGSNDSITIISEKVGFQSVYYFSRFFKSHEGVTPNEFRRRNREFIIKDFQGNITDFS